MAPIVHPYAPHSGQIVIGPRAGDGVGRALRSSFVGDDRLPPAIADCLDRLNHIHRH